MSLRDDLFVEPDESVNGSFSDLQRGKVREKVIANKETHENPVIYGSLEGGREAGERETQREGGKEGRGGGRERRDGGREREGQGRKGGREMIPS